VDYTRRSVAIRADTTREVVPGYDILVRQLAWANITAWGNLGSLGAAFHLPGTSTTYTFEDFLASQAVLLVIDDDMRLGKGRDH